MPALIASLPQSLMIDLKIHHLMKDLAVQEMNLSVKEMPMENKTNCNFLMLVI